MGFNKTLTNRNGEQYRAHVEAVLQRLQPELSSSLVEGSIGISGNLICSGDEGPFDAFEISALLPIGFPMVEPFVWETGGRIPRMAERHIYPRPGNCCLCVWEEWLWGKPDVDFEDFLVGPLHSYFVSQSIFEMTEEWPFGERDHDKKGLDQALAEMLSDVPNVLVDRALAILSQPKMKGHARCPCGSGLRLRDCHYHELVSARQKLPPLSWKKLKGRRKLYSASGK